MIYRSELVKPTRMQQMFAAMECRLSIASVDETPVQSRYALVQLTDLDAWEVCFTSDLVLPAYRNITVSLDLMTPCRPIRLTGTRIRRAGGSPPYDYRVYYEMAEADRKELFEFMNGKTALPESRIEKAMDSYITFHTYNHCVPQIDFQT